MKNKLNFYQKFEKQLEDFGHSISGRYDYNNETFSENPDFKKLELGVLVDTRGGNAYDVSWDNYHSVYNATVIEGDNLEDEVSESIKELCNLLK